MNSVSPQGVNSLRTFVLQAIPFAYLPGVFQYVQDRSKAASPASSRFRVTLPFASYSTSRAQAPKAVSYEVRLETPSAGDWE